MVTSKEGILTSNNVGAFAATGGTGERVLVDYKDALQDYKTTDIPALQLFTETMTTDTGGDIDLTFAMPSMNMERIDEGSTPKYQHTKMRSERVAVREWGIAVGVTRRMIEDSRFNEVELALNEARRAVDRHMSKHVVYALMGIGDADLLTGRNNSGTFEDIVKGTAEVGSPGVNDFDNVLYGGFLGSGTAAQAAAGDGRYVDYGLTTTADIARSHYVEAATDSAVTLAELTQAIELIGSRGYNADTIVISPKHYKSLLDLADFTVAATSASPAAGGNLGAVNETNQTGLVGQLYGLNIFVNAYVPPTRYGVFDLSVKPMAYVERRGMTVEEANPGFGIVGSYMSMRYGLKVTKPETGVIFYNA